MVDTLEFFFDIASPYSYLAATQVNEVARRCALKPRWRPFLLGAVFKATGNIPPASVPAKGAWSLRDLDGWAAYYGVEFAFNPAFPPNSLRLGRVLAGVELDGDEESLQRLAMALYTAFWARRIDVTDFESFKPVVDAAGFDADRLWAQAERPDVKERLRSTTDEAVERGAFGAPTFFVGERMYWGADRLILLEADLSVQPRG